MVGRFGAVLLFCGIVSVIGGADDFRRVSLGLGLHTNISTNVRENYMDDSEFEEKGVSFGFMPFVGIRPSKLFEIRPSIGFQLYSRTEEWDDDSDSLSYLSSDSEFSQFGLGFSVGGYFYLAENEHLRFSLGPELSSQLRLPPKINGESDMYDTYVNLNAGVAVPFNFDFIIKNRIGLKLSANLLSYYVNVNYKESESLDQSDIYYDFNILTSGWDPGISLFLLF